MKILAINGSHRVGQNTDILIDIALDAARQAGTETEVIELAECNIEFCTGCNRCLFKPECSIKDDDMRAIKQKMLEADGILIASPNYFSNVTARMKNFFDRTRPLHMTSNQLKGKVAGFLTMGGLDNTGSETANAIMENFCATHEMLIVHARPEGPVLGSGVTGSLLDSVEDGIPHWRRSVKDDPIAPLIAAQLGKDMVELIERLA